MDRIRDPRPELDELIPYDAKPPMQASGVRLGTAAITTRGLGVGEMQRLGGWIADTLQSPADESVLQRVRGELAEVARAFPIYSHDSTPTA